jgi:hypothetical protein
MLRRIVDVSTTVPFGSIDNAGMSGTYNDEAKEKLK